MERIWRRLLFIGGAVLAILTFGTAGFVFIEHYPLFDAFYITLTTITTINSRDVSELSRGGAIFNSFLIFFGVTVMFLAVGAITQSVIELELNQFFGKRRIKRMIDKMQDHFIVCGWGRVGRGAAEELKEAGVPFVVLDSNDVRVEQAIHAGHVAVLADATKDELLIDAGIMRARGLIATLRSDADNLFLILSARALNAKLVLATRVSEEESEQKLRRAGADFVFAPYKNTGHRMAQALLRPHVLQFLDFTTQKMDLNVGIEQVRVSEDSEFLQRSLRQMQLRRDLGVIVLAIRKANGTMLFNPPAEAELAGGDYLIAMGEHQQLRRLERLLMGSEA